jgi:hypothetical protein
LVVFHYLDTNLFWNYCPEEEDFYWATRVSARRILRTAMHQISKMTITEEESACDPNESANSHDPMLPPLQIFGDRNLPQKENCIDILQKAMGNIEETEWSIEETSAEEFQELIQNASVALLLEEDRQEEYDFHTVAKALVSTRPDCTKVESHFAQVPRASISPKQAWILGEKDVHLFLASHHFSHSRWMLP